MNQLSTTNDYYQVTYTMTDGLNSVTRTQDCTTDQVATKYAKDLNDQGANVISVLKVQV